jgi:hypothetical protein
VARCLSASIDRQDESLDSLLKNELLMRKENKMNMARMLFAIFLCVALAVLVNSQNKITGAGVLSIGTALAAEGAPSPQGASSQQASVSNQDINPKPLINYIDINKDDCMTKEEWDTAGMPKMAFEFMAKDGCVKPETFSPVRAEGIDINGDGFLTIEEFIEYDRRKYGDLEPATPHGEARKEKPNYQPLINTVDANKDGCMTKDEWNTAGAPMSFFNTLVQDGCVTQKNISASKALEGVDLNNDGFVTILELKAFEKRNSSGAK